MPDNDRTPVPPPANRPRRGPRPRVEDDEPTGSVMINALPQQGTPPARPVEPAGPQSVFPRSVRERRSGR